MSLRGAQQACPERSRRVALIKRSVTNHEDHEEHEKIFDYLTFMSYRPINFVNFVSFVVKLYFLCGELYMIAKEA